MGSLFGLIIQKVRPTRNFEKNYGFAPPAKKWKNLELHFVSFPQHDMTQISRLERYEYLSEITKYKEWWPHLRLRTMWRLYLQLHWKGAVLLSLTGPPPNWRHYFFRLLLVTVAATLNAHSEEFKVVKLSGPNVLSQADKAVALLTMLVHIFEIPAINLASMGRRKTTKITSRLWDSL